MTLLPPMSLAPWLILAAVVLDTIFDKPYKIGHPVIVIAKGLDVLEGWARAWHERGILGMGRFRWRMNLRTSGKLCLFLAIFCTANVVYWLCALPLMGFVLAVLFSAMGLSLGNLLYEAGKAANAIEYGTLDEGRHAVSMLVSRETSHLNRDALRRALAETVSENFNDGFVAPLFWLTLTGPVGLWVYKCVSTIDSMWGYRNEKYEEFGKAGARLDDVLAYIPARISAFLLWITGPLVWRGAWPWIFARIKRDAMTMESPNAGWPMATAAWLHGAPMGGAAMYFGAVKDKPVLGPKVDKDGVPYRFSYEDEAADMDEGMNGGMGADVGENMAGATDTVMPSASDATSAYSTDDTATASGSLTPSWTHARLTKLFRHIRYAGIVGAVLAFGFSVMAKATVTVIW